MSGGPEPSLAPPTRLEQVIDHMIEAHKLALLDGDPITRAMLELVLRHLATRLVAQIADGPDEPTLQ